MALPRHRGQVVKAMSDKEGAPVPRILLVMPDQWSRVLLRAELIERGWDAVGATSLKQAVAYAAAEPRRGPVGLILVDQRALREGWEPLVGRLANQHGEPPVVLLVSTQSELPGGQWSEIIARPAAIGEIASRLEGILHSAQASNARNVAAPRLRPFETRLGQPWPKIACARCHTTRHYEPPRSDGEARALEADMSKFAREHRACRD
jgi:hypothetical protein